MNLTFPSPAKRALQILLVADHAIERRALAMLLNAQRWCCVIAEAHDTDTALDALRKHRPEVVLIAARIHGLVRVEEVRRIRSESPSTRIVVLASSDCEAVIFTAFDAGASEYVLRSAQPEEFFAAIRRVQAGAPSLPPGLRRRLAGRPRLLTTRELEVLDLMRRGMTDREIGLALSISPQTAKSHAKSIFVKLEAASRAEAVAEGFERGLLAVA